jgi:hypothetical protein
MRRDIYDTILHNTIYILTAIGLKPGGSSTVHIYTQTVHRTTQSTQTMHRTAQSSTQNNTIRYTEHHN